jgi:uncharacterized protein YjbI with pentapeptide repeats
MHASSIQVSSLAGADLTNASLGSVLLINSSLEGADLTGAIFPHAVWINVTCPNGSLQSSPCGP